MIGESAEKAGPTQGRPTPYNLQCPELDTLLEKKEFRDEPAPPLSETIKYLKTQPEKQNSESDAKPKAKRPNTASVIPFNETFDLPNGPLRVGWNKYKNKFHFITTEDKRNHLRMALQRRKQWQVGCKSSRIPGHHQWNIQVVRALFQSFYSAT